MKLNLDELEQLAAQATPGPWKLVVSDKYTFTVAILPPDFPQTPLVGRIRDEQDAAYIVASCNAVSALVAELKAEREKVKELEAQRDWLASKLGDMCSVSSRGSCGVPEPCPYSKGYCRCLDVEQEEWVQVVKEAKC